MNLKPTLALLGILITSGSGAAGQEAAATDLLGSVRHPDRVAFVMRVDPPPPAGENSTVLSSLEIRKTGEVQHGIEHFANGTKREWWGTTKFTASTAFVFGTGDTVVAELLDESDEESEFSFFALETVPGLLWLKRARDLGATQLDGRSCRHIVSVATMPDGSTPRGEVWIDEKSGLPFRLRTEETVFSIEYLPPPTQNLEVPAEFRKPVIEMAERLQRMEAIRNSGRR